MEQNLSNAVSILVVGMITVLLILWFVVIIGNLLIRVTNKYWPAPQNEGKTGTGIRTISSGTIAAIMAAVEAVTGGEGKVTKIEKE
ncbi:MAG: OadG family protein [Mariniphaga sp.]|nr:OadG family protein [Mariniphaga sp.]